MPDLEGGLTIRMKIPADASPNTVQIHSTRPVHACRVFEGKQADEALRLLPLLYSVCGIAQSCAGVRAVERAMDNPRDHQTERLRDALVNMETIREHLWQIFLHWPHFLGAEVHKQAMVDLVALQQAYRQALCADTDLFQIGAVADSTDSTLPEPVLEKLQTLLRNEVFSVPPEQWLAINDLQGLQDWSRLADTMAAGLIRRVLERNWQNSGACKTPQLSQITETQIHHLLQDATFVEKPQWEGECRETSSLTRNQTPLLNVLHKEYGNGLLVRLVARLTELAKLPLSLMPSGMDQRSLAYTKTAQTGIGQSDAARGQLLHAVSLDGNRIYRYQILAPTEWNFHPQGVVAQSLASLKGELDTITEQAHLLINAIDPCVSYQLQVVSGNERKSKEVEPEQCPGKKP
ncbi:nickel-dependent hydrogenase large subunit [Thiolapillus sp.]